MTTRVEKAEAGLIAANEALTLARRAEEAARRELRDAKTAAAEEAKRAARRSNDRARATAKRKAARLGVTIETEQFPDGPIYWVWAPEGRYPNEDADPLCGEHSCCGWFEVLRAVEEYEQAFAKEDAAS